MPRLAELKFESFGELRSKDQRKIDPSSVHSRRRNIEKLKFMRELNIINHTIKKKMTIDAFALMQVDGIMLASLRDRRD